MIELKNLSKSYTATTKAVDDLSLTISDGEIFGFLGPNGAGKTTTIKMLTGIIKPDQGSISINGIDILKEPLVAKKEFGFVPDNPNVFLRLKGIEYLNFMADIYDVPSEVRVDRVNLMAKRFEMTKALGDKIQSYSHGMRQKIIVMGALIHEPPVWILDEPLTGLDPRSSYVLKEMMREHTEAQKTVFFSTHVLEVAEKICDRVAIINQGKILYSGRLDAMKDHFNTSESLEKIFLEMTESE